MAKTTTATTPEIGNSGTLISQEQIECLDSVATRLEELTPTMGQPDVIAHEVARIRGIVTALKAPAVEVEG